MIQKKYKFGESMYDYDFDESIEYRDDKTGKRRIKGFEWNWKEYEETGIWKGYEYYKKPQLDYRYIEQMANAFAAKYDVSVQVGDAWSADVKGKILTYNPLTLMYNTKAFLIAILLHEIGHLRYSTDPGVLSSPFLRKHKMSAFSVMNLFEDFRIDAIMIKAYEGAEDVYKANKPIIKEIAKKYSERSELIHSQIIDEIKFLLSKALLGSSVQLKQKLKETLNSKSVREVEEKIKKIEKKFKERDTLFDYCATITLLGYNEKVIISKGKLKKRIEKTKHVPKLAIESKSNQELLTMLDKEVYPVIKDLLEELKGKEGILKVLFGKDIAGKIMDQILHFTITERLIEDMFKSINSRSSGHSSTTFPMTWRQGNYNELKDSVISIINELVRKLTFLRRSENVTRWIPDQKRGKLNSKNIYKQRLYNTRIFKNKIEVIDTISSFAFSLVLDVSGSMYPNAIIHSIRGLIVFMEVFKKMNIPFEIIIFGDMAEILKTFNDELNKTKKAQIAGVITKSYGGTNLYKVFSKTELIKRSEKNKIMIILSDGGVDMLSNYDRKFKEYKEKGTKVIGVGIKCGNKIVNLCLGNGLAINNPSELPMAFSGILKELIFKKKKV